MGQQFPTLDDLRREVDGIDDAMHDLLIRRAEVSRAIALVKQPGAGADVGSLTPAMRPAREAEILRRLLARHRGDLPPQVVVRIWREIIAASLRMQSKYQLHVFAGNHETAFLNLANAYFGLLAPIRSHPRVSLVVHACTEETNSLGLVPLPEIEDPGAAWWAQLAPAGQPGPRVIAKLPFVTNGDELPSAYVIGAIEQEASGDDTTLLLLEISAGLSRTKLQSLLQGAGFKAKLAATGRTSDKKVPDEALIEVKGFIGKDDKRLKALAEAAGEAVLRIAPIGGFANPVVLTQAGGQR